MSDEKKNNQANVSDNLPDIQIDDKEIFLAHFPIDIKKVHDVVIQKIAKYIHLVENKYDYSYGLSSEKAYLAWAEDNIFNKLTLLKNEDLDYETAKEQLKEACNNMGMVKATCSPAVFKELIEEDEITHYLKYRQSEPLSEIVKTKEQLNLKNNFIPCPNCGSTISYSYLADKYDLSDGMICPVCDATIITKEKAVYLDVLDKECKNLQSQLDEYLSKKYPLLTSCWLLSFELPCR